MRASVVIVTYNRLRLLKECLQCVDNQLVKFDDIVIVENCSTDGTVEYLKEKVDKYHIIFEKENGGGAKGFQDGVDYVRNNLQTDWLLLIDDDAMLCKSYLKVLVQYIHSFPTCRAFSGSVKTDGIIDVTHRKRLRRGIKFRITPVELNEYNKEFFEYDLSSFCGLFYSANLIATIGIPRGDYFIWFDDSEYSLRIRKETQIININSIWINHKTILNTGTPKLNWKGYYGTRNCGDIIKRYGNSIELFMFQLRIRIAMYKNLFMYILHRDSTYKYNYHLYKDGLNDFHSGKFGFNSNYHA